MNPIPISWVEKLFERMSLLYGTHFADKWKGHDPELIKRLWAEELGYLTRQELAFGASKLSTLEWPPSLPQFLKLCRPPVDYVKAYYEALEGSKRRDKGEHGSWSHPAIFWAYMAIGAFDLQNTTFSNIKTRWERALDKEIMKMNWPPIPEPMVKIETKKQEPNRELGAKKIGELAAKVFENKGDGLDWARKIIATPNKYPSISLKVAYEAMKGRS